MTIVSPYVCRRVRMINHIIRNMACVANENGRVRLVIVAGIFTTWVCEIYKTIGVVIDAIGTLLRNGHSKYTELRQNRRECKHRNDKRGQTGGDTCFY